MSRRVGCLARHEADTPGGHQCAGRQRLAPEPRRDPLELLGGRAGAVDVALGDLDLNLRVEERRSPQVGVRWLSFDGALIGCSSAWRIDATAASTSPRASWTSARPGWGSQPAWWARIAGPGR
jgi:hypothetical protein